MAQEGKNHLRQDFPAATILGLSTKSQLKIGSSSSSSCSLALGAHFSTVLSFQRCSLAHGVLLRLRLFQNSSFRSATTAVLNLFRVSSFSLTQLKHTAAAGLNLAFPVERPMLNPFFFTHLKLSSLLS